MIPFAAMRTDGRDMEERKAVEIDAGEVRSINL
jgi:hypothetical protein